MDLLAFLSYYEVLKGNSLTIVKLMRLENGKLTQHRTMHLGMLSLAQYIKIRIEEEDK